MRHGIGVQHALQLMRAGKRDIGQKRVVLHPDGREHDPLNLAAVRSSLFRVVGKTCPGYAHRQDRLGALCHHDHVPGPHAKQVLNQLTQLLILQFRRRNVGLPVLEVLRQGCISRQPRRDESTAFELPQVLFDIGCAFELNTPKRPWPIVIYHHVGAIQNSRTFLFDSGAHGLKLLAAYGRGFPGGKMRLVLGNGAINWGNRFSQELIQCRKKRFKGL